PAEEWPRKQCKQLAPLRPGNRGYQWESHGRPKRSSLQNGCLIRKGARPRSLRRSVAVEKRFEACCIVNIVPKRFSAGGRKKEAGTLPTEKFSAWKRVACRGGRSSTSQMNPAYPEAR